MELLNFIIWNVDPALFTMPEWLPLLGGREIRYYGLFFAFAFIVSQYVMNYVYKTEGKPIEDVDSLTMYVIGGTIIGARLGHCFFYDFDYYVLQHPLEIFKIWEGGLASHGGAIGILVGLYLYHKKFNYNFVWLLDRVVIVVAISAFCIRMGNLMNSEIVGLETDVSWAVQFVRNDCPPPYNCDISTVPARHATQVYEGLSYLFLFGLLMFLYVKTDFRNHAGRLFGVLMVAMFTFRFFYEFLKENQSAFEEGMMINMGQVLSIPFILIGVYFFVKSYKNDNSAH